MGVNWWLSYNICLDLSLICLFFVVSILQQHLPIQATTAIHFYFVVRCNSEKSQQSISTGRVSDIPYLILGYNLLSYSLSLSITQRIIRSEESFNTKEIFMRLLQSSSQLYRHVSFVCCEGKICIGQILWDSNCTFILNSHKN